MSDSDLTSLVAVQIQAGDSGHFQRLERGQHAVGVCDDGAGARGRGDAGVGGAGGGAGGHIQRAERGKHAVGCMCVRHSSRLRGRKLLDSDGVAAPDIPGRGWLLQHMRLLAGHRSRKAGLLWIQKSGMGR
jgi:hypothetical protein